MTRAGGEELGCGGGGDEGRRLKKCPQEKDLGKAGKEAFCNF